jgi:hypothetical protein
MAKQPNKLDDQIQQQLKERNRAVATIEKMATQVDLVEFATRLNKHPHLADLIDVCLDKCIDEHLINKNAYKLRPPLAEDVERVDLHLAWLRAVAISNQCSLSTLNSVKVRGYLQAMLRQIEKLEDIGIGGFARLKRSNALQYSAEYLMRKYYSDMLSAEQIEKIDVLLKSNGIEI